MRRSSSRVEAVRRGVEAGEWSAPLEPLTERSRLFAEDALDAAHAGPDAAGSDRPPPPRRAGTRGRGPGSTRDERVDAGAVEYDAFGAGSGQAVPLDDFDYRSSSDFR
jgi:hypothetical protein